MADWKWQGPDKLPEQLPPAPAPPAKGAKTQKARALFKDRPGRLSSTMVALSATAILSVYAAGYLNTSAAHDALNEPLDIPAVQASSADDATATATATTPAATSTTSSGRGRSAASTATTAPAATTTPVTPAAAAEGAYADGTYVGIGTSRHGNVEVTVVVEGGAITAATITDCSTHYPCSRISSLPGQVVAGQTASVDTISGATDSSRAFAKAVASALSQAAA